MVIPEDAGRGGWAAVLSGREARRLCLKRHGSLRDLRRAVSGSRRDVFSPRFLSHLFYDVSADGQRFLVDTELPEEPSPLTLVVNWTAGLAR